MTETVEAPSPRKHKSKDYRRIAVEAAQASVAKQTAVHIAALEAMDAVADATDAVARAQAEQRQAMDVQAVKITAMVDLLGLEEAAARLALPSGQVRSLCRRKPADGPAENTDPPVQSPAA